MIKKVLSVYDCKAQMYSGPIFVVAVGVGVRAFADAVNDNQLEFSKHPTDYILFEIGDWDDNTGEFKNCVPPHQLGVGADFVRKELKDMVVESVS